MARLRRSLTAADRRQIAWLAAAIIGLHVAGIVLLVLASSGGFTLGTGAVFGIALGVTAYALGARHAFDADHIAAIDNVTRKLVSDGQRPLSVGFFFSLGHSTVVLVLALLLAIGIRGLGAAVDDESSVLHQVTGAIGPSVAGAFLILIGVLNAIILIGIVRVFRRMRQGEFDERQLDRQLEQRGFLNRFYGRVTRAVDRPWKMYPLGFLFGLGFDTATEIALLATAGTAAAGDLPFYAILSLPLLFAAGMSLFDTIDGGLMCFAYRWAFLKPVRKVFYNLTVTALSSLVALVIGPIVLLSAFSEQLGVDGGVVGFLAGINLEYVGFAIVALFLLTWAIAVAVWRFGHIEERWSAGPDRSEAGV